MNRKSKAVAAIMLGAMCAGLVQAQEEQETPPQMFFIVAETVKPSMTEGYEKAIKKMISEFDAYGVTDVEFHTISGPEMGYVYVMPVEGFEGMSSVRDAWMGAIETIGEDKFDSIVKKADASVASVDRFHAIYHADSSYTPENPDLSPDEITFIGYTFVYVEPGYEEEMLDIAAEFAKLYEQNGINLGWSAYTQVTGTDLPLMVIARPAKSRADYYQQNEMIEQKLGEAGKSLRDKAAKHFRRIEMKEGWLRPDLSYPPVDVE